MLRIIEIVGVEEKADSKGNLYYRTHAVLEDGDECVGFGKDFKIGDLVERFYDHAHDVTKMQKRKLDKH